MHYLSPDPGLAGKKNFRLRTILGIFENVPAMRMAVLLSSLVLACGPALAQNWEEVSPDLYYYDPDSAFVDMESGVVVVETAMRGEANDYDYDLVGIDCDGWNVYGLATRGADGNYRVYENWGIDPTVGGPIPAGSLVETLANRLCPFYESLPLDFLP